MASGRSARQARRARSDGDVKLNITSMMDMFTIILVFLIKNYSTEGAIVSPADDLTLPKSTVEMRAKESLNLMVAQGSIVVEDKRVLDKDAYAQLLAQKEFMIAPLQEVLSRYAEEARKMEAVTGKEFSGSISIQGDTAIPYNVLTRIMYTCGQAGYPNMNLLVYRPD
jgi:biopolymer transport protein ExbD